MKVNRYAYSFIELVTKLSLCIVPIGFLYFYIFIFLLVVERVQLPDRPSPQELWPNLIWRNVTGEFAGLFFRAEGGTSDSFGTVQEQSDNHLVQVELSYHPGNGFNPPDVITVPASGYSDYVEAGAIAPTWTSREALRFRNSGAESRPRNTAVRIWERA